MLALDRPATALIQGAIMTVRKATKRKPPKITKVLANQTIADIKALIKTEKKLDLELKKIERRIKKLILHHYFV
jgi:hypothetical protein